MKTGRAVTVIALGLLVINRMPVLLETGSLMSSREQMAEYPLAYFVLAVIGAITYIVARDEAVDLRDHEE